MLRDLGRATQGSPYCCAEYQIVKHKTIAGEFKILAFEKYDFRRFQALARSATAERWWMLTRCDRFTDEAAHAAHRESRHFKSFMKRVEERAMLEKPIEIIGGPVVGGFAVEDVSF